MQFKGPKGVAYVYKGEAHDWTVEFWASGTHKHPGRHVKRTVSRSYKTLAITLAKQLTGLFK